MLLLYVKLKIIQLQTNLNVSNEKQFGEQLYLMKLWPSSGSWCPSWKALVKKSWSRTTSVAEALWFPQEFLHSQCTLEGSEVVPETPLCFSTSKKHHAPQKMQWWFSTCMPNTLVCKCGVVFGWRYTLGDNWKGVWRRLQGGNTFSLAFVERLVFHDIVHNTVDLRRVQNGITGIYYLSVVKTEN